MTWMALLSGVTEWTGALTVIIALVVGISVLHYWKMLRFQAMRAALANFIHNVQDTLACKLARRVSQRLALSQDQTPLADESWLAGFNGDLPPSQTAYADLFRYFVAGFVAHRSPLGAYADYVGMGSYNGPEMDRLEGFSRLAPLIAAWLHGGRSSRINLGSQTVDLLELLRTGLLNGTDPSSTEYWGKIKHWGQAIVEAADIALVLWLTQHLLWDALTEEQRTRVADWLLQVNHKGIPDNNWHLFVVQVNTVLAALGKPHDGEELALHYQRAKAFYRGDGWFRDGDQPDTPGFDFYNAWGFHYHLQWIDHIAPDLDAHFIAVAFREFIEKYRYFLGPAGFPILGRSACYRMAAAAPLVMAQAHHPNLVSPGQARRALDSIWQYFIRQGALAKGNVSQGYFTADPRLLENYSGPASCLWSLRSLVAAFALPDLHPFWVSQPEPLPVEKADFSIPVGPTGWTLVGTHATGSITLFTDHGDNQTLERQSTIDRIAEMFTCKPRRPKNTSAKYYRSRYDSTAPYGMNAIPLDSRKPSATPELHNDARL